MNIPEFSADQKTCTIDGYTFIATTGNGSHKDCNKCAFARDCISHIDAGAMLCIDRDRLDGRPIYWVKSDALTVSPTESNTTTDAKNAIFNEMYKAMGEDSYFVTEWLIANKEFIINNLTKC